MKNKLAVMGMVAAIGLALPLKAEASYTIYLYESGSNVIATGSGSLDLTGLSDQGFAVHTGGVEPDIAYLSFVGGAGEAYGAVSSPAQFGTGSALTSPSSSSGNVVAFASGAIEVPTSYVSDTPLGTSTDIFDGTTLSGLGVTPGTYVWTWGSGANADSATLYAGQMPPVPEPASLVLMASGILGLTAARRRLGKSSQ